MRKYLSFMISLTFIFLLSGCLGEDYDVGVPTAHLGLGTISKQLTEASISWDTARENVLQTIDDIKEFALSKGEIKIFPNQQASLEFKENEENGGDIFTDEKITVAIWKDGQRIELERNDRNEFQFPTEKGHYVLEVNFSSTAGQAQYVGNIVIV
jgi:hypothetical protein